MGIEVCGPVRSFELSILYQVASLVPGRRFYNRCISRRESLGWSARSLGEWGRTEPEFTWKYRKCGKCGLSACEQGSSRSKWASRTIFVLVCLLCPSQHELGGRRQTEFELKLKLEFCQCLRCNARTCINPASSVPSVRTNQRNFSMAKKWATIHLRCSYTRTDRTATKWSYSKPTVLHT